MRKYKICIILLIIIILLSISKITKAETQGFGPGTTSIVTQSSASEGTHSDAVLTGSNKQESVEKAVNDYSAKHGSGSGSGTTTIPR